MKKKYKCKSNQSNQIFKRGECKSISILGKDNGYAAKNTDVAIIIPTIDPDESRHILRVIKQLWHLMFHRIKQKIQMGVRKNE